MNGSHENEGKSAGRALMGLALLGGVAAVGYVVYKWYARTKAQEQPTAPVRITVPIPATTKPRKA